MRTEFDPVTHEGKVDGQQWPSVSQILKEFGLLNLDGIQPDILEAKRNLGVRVHAATVLLDSGELDEEHFNATFPECIPYLEGYRKFRIIEKLNVLHKEERLFSKKWKFHGCPDEVAVRELDGRNVIVDYKTSWKVYPATACQLEAYRILVEECRGIKIAGVYSLMLKPNGTYDFKESKEPGAKIDFLHALSLHWRKRSFYK